MGQLVWRRMIASTAGEGASTLRVMTTMSARRKAGERLAQSARGQHQAAAKRIHCIHQHDVRIARQFQMLKPVVQHKAIDSVPRQNHAVLVAVRAHAKLELFPQAARAAAQPHRSAERRSRQLPQSLDTRASKSQCSSLPGQDAARSLTLSAFSPCRPPSNFLLQSPFPAIYVLRNMPARIAPGFGAHNRRIDER